ncbi:penicillin acylase [Amylibacter kogurei]|uniref:Penicillin acylase n=1 Tax=Paramylibacter kogurei TaxID=1889778 RepID=A0A2G5K5S8_9RHOB|nr:penicillin acylase family protein [Amylibacter kogurei]PIB24765.1 penicillin acylase [Amylibacter kogurei]
MAVTFKWLTRLFLLLCVLGLGAMAIAYYFASRSIPDFNQNYTVDGLSGPIEIVRDNHSVPHIFAQNDPDVYYGLGFSHAQDRLWQMLILRRTAQGRLSEILGEQTLSVDEFVRRLDIYNLSSASFQYQTDETKTALKSYSDGVNAWLKVVQSDALGRGAPELFLFSPQIAPWTPTDSLAVMRVMALQISNNLQDEILRAKAALTVGNERMRDLMPDSPNDAVMALPEYASLFENPPRSFSPQPTQHALHPIKPREFAGASNAWAADGSRAARKAPLLATDPHLGLSAPSIWMLARMEFSDGGVIGATIPGLPFIVSGRSDDLAWGLTTTYLDDLDVYVEKLNPANSDEYLTPNGYKPFIKKRVIVDIKDQLGKTIDMRWTENGPVIPSDSFDLGAITPIGHVTSINWTALREQDQSVSAGIRLMRSKSIAAARNAVSMHHAPGQNLILADKNSVALQVVGHMPKRDPNHASLGRIPSQGWLIQNRWLGDFPFSENPNSVNPASGVVANTNNKITDEKFPKHVGHNWGDTQRIKRLTKLLNARKVHTRDSFMEAQLDPVSYTARSLLTLIGRELWFKGEPAASGTVERQRQIALELLSSWNGEMDQHVPEPLIYTAWLRNLQQRLIADDLGPLSKEFYKVQPVFIERVFRDIDGASKWCDILPSSEIETCVDIARIALDAALLELSEQYGSSIDSWRWGQAHQAKHDHQVLGNIPLLSWFVNIRQDTPGGDNTLLRARTAGKGAEPYANVHAAGFRALVDFADPESSLYIISTGQSGHFLSRHYDDLAQLWRRGEYIPMTLDPELARSGSDGVMVLSPRAQP